MEKVVFSNLFNSVNKSKIIIQMEILVPTAAVSYPVEHVRPALESDALEDRQHGLPDIVEVCDPVLRALPVVSTDSPIRTLIETSTGGGLLGHLPCRMISYSGIQWTTILGNKLYTQKSYLVRVTEGRIEFKVIS